MPNDETPNLGLPYILAAQAQKHVTHNEAIRKLDAIVQIGVEARDLSAPPASPAEGERYIVAVAATGLWAGQTGKLAAFQDGGWMFLSPVEGWLAWISSEQSLVVWDGSDWVEVVAPLSLNPTPLLGVNATADAGNRLAVSSPASLFNHEGAGHQVKVNKAAAADTASLLFQTAFSGRAEMGLAGSDNFAVKVSADGAAWTDAIVVDRATGAVALPATPARIILRVYTASGAWAKPAGLKKVHVWGIGGGAGTPDSTAAAGEIALTSGGGSGTFGFKAIDAAALGATETVTIGAAGTPASNAGGTTSFGAHMTLPGAGAPAVLASGTSGSTTGVGGIAGTATGADWSVRGSYPLTRGRRSSGTDGLAGSGASSFFGTGGTGAGPGGNGTAALAWGAGAGGSCANSTTTRTGANGGAGVLFVEEHY